MLPRPPRRRSRPGRLVALALPVLVTAGLLSACSGSADDLPDLPDLTSAFEADGVSAYPVEDNSHPVSSWTTDEAIVTFEAERYDAVVTALDPETGRAIGTTRVDGSLCAVSDEMDQFGRGVVMTRTGAGQCDTVALVAPARSKVLWQQRVPSADAFYGRSAVAGSDAVYVSGRCGQLQRLALSDGRLLAPLGDVQKSSAVLPCDGRQSISGPVGVYTTGDPERPVTVVRNFAVGLNDVQRFRVAGLVEGVVSTDPMVVIIAQDGHRVMQRLDFHNVPRTVIGLEPDNRGFDAVATIGDVLVGTYGAPGYQDELFAYDTITGRELWRRDDDRYGAGPRLFGVQRHQLVWGQLAETEEGDAAYPGDQTWITRTDPRDPSKGGTLGRVAGDTVLSGAGDPWFVAGDLLLSSTSSRLEAFDIGVAGEDGVQLVPASRLSDVASESWGPDDVTDTEALTACTAVGPEALDLLRLRSDLPAPADCWWDQRRRGWQTTLRVSVEPSQPGTDADSEEELSGSEMAHAQLLATRQSLSGGGPVDGIGEEAFVSLATDRLTDPSTLVSDSPLASATQVLARSGNVLVTVTASSEATAGGPTGAAPPDDVDAAAVTAARDVLAALDLDAGAVDPGADGPVSTAPEACRAGADTARALVPGREARDVTPIGSTRWRGCTWTRPYETSLIATSRALPADPTTGQSATSRAADLLDGFRGRPVDDVGDQAVLVNLADSEYSFSYRTLVVLVARRDNLVVELRYDSEAEDGPGRSAVTRELEQYARTLLEQR